ncbi:MAG TPA: cytochrome c [Hyphomicrobium sp.]|nr:cytochrome c [Hyphomicrobium sp.]
MRFQPIHSLSWVVALAVSASCLSASVRAETEPAAADGQAILEKNCARCHAIGATGDSPHPQAPPFREVVKRYPVEDLEESLAEGIVSGHPDMPEFTFKPEEIGAIISYLNDLKAKTTGN